MSAENEMVVQSVSDESSSSSNYCSLAYSLGIHQNGDVGVCVPPESKKVLVGVASSHGFSLHRICFNCAYPFSTLS